MFQFTDEQKEIYIAVSTPESRLAVDGNRVSNLRICNLQFCLDTVRHYARKGNPVAQANLEKILTIDGPFKNGLLSGEIMLRPFEVDKPRKHSKAEDLYMFLDEERGVCKIGRSNDVASRLDSVQTGYPYKLAIRSIFKGKGSSEREIHCLLKKFRLNGEWFSADCLPFFDSIVGKI